MINWYGVQVFLFILASLINFILVLSSIISLWMGLFIWTIGLPVVFTIMGFILYKMEQKGYIHKNEISR